MAKSTKTYMVRRGKRYLIERKADGTFGKWIPVAGKKTKQAKTTQKSPDSKSTTKTHANKPITS
jgi:hypothetical protein